MKKISILLVLSAILVAATTGCGPKKIGGKPGSSGKTLELMVVTTNAVYNGPARHALDSLFQTPQDGLNQPEPRFDMVQITPSSFEGNTMFQAHRNILILEINPQNINKIYLSYDVWSTPQVVIRITSPDAQSLDSMLLVHGERLLKEFYAQEYRRMDKVFSQKSDYKIQKAIKDKYGFDITIPDEFAMAKMKEESDFMWVLKQTKDFDLHLYIYSSPYSDKRCFEEPVILDNIDTILRRYVPGPSEGSYPGVERRDFFYSREVKIGTTDAVETRGLWRTYNDFMGGPFVCYTFLSPEGDKVLTLMGAVYSPSQRNKMLMKRDLLMQLDGICRSVRF